jgi:hypothetical protein
MRLPACLAAGLSVLLDVACTLPGPTHNNNHGVPASMRATAITTTILLASAPVLDAYVVEQRILLLLVLGLACLFGDQVGSMNATTADSIFTLVAIAASVLSFLTSGGAGDAIPTLKSSSVVNTGVISLACALLVLWSMRQLRTAFFGHEIVIGFETDLATSFAIVDEVVVVAKAFCASVGGGAAFFVLLNNDLVETSGLESLRGGLRALSFALLLGAVLQQQAAESAAVGYLGVLFGDDACGAQFGCESADRARRFYTCSTQSTSAFVTSFSLLLLCLHGKARPQSRSVYHGSDYVATQTTQRLLLLLGFVCTVVVVYPTTLSVSLATLLLSVAITSEFPLVGLLLHTIGVALTAFDLDLSYLSHWVLVASLALLGVLLLGTMVSDALYSFNLLYVVWIEEICAVLQSALLGLQTALLLGGALLPVASNGGKFETPTLFTERHFLTAFFILEFAAARHETFTTWVKRVAYFGIPASLFLAWISTTNSDLYEQSLDTPLLVVCSLGAVAVWCAVGWCV